MKLIDTHAHLYLKDFASDIDDVLKKAKDEGVEKIYLPAIDSEHIAAMLALADRRNTICIPMMGLHPCSVKENYKDELAIVEKYLSERKFAAVGEIGLDFYWDKTFTKEQYEAFITQIDLAIKHQLPIVIHTRNAMQETIDVVKKNRSKGIRGIFHCFSGSYENAMDIINEGFYIGIGGVLTYKNAGLAEVLKKIDLKYMVLETDAPYLTPVPYRGKRNESSYIKYVAEKLALIKNISVEEVAAITTENAMRVFTD